MSLVFGFKNSICHKVEKYLVIFNFLKSSYKTNCHEEITLHYHYLYTRATINRTGSANWRTTFCRTTADAANPACNNSA